MALQTVEQPGVATSAVVFPISELSTYQSRWTIRARVTSKAPMRSFTNRTGGEGKVFHVELVDTAGGEIRASFFNDAAAKFGEVLQVGKLYTLSRGSVKVANRKYNSCNHRYELIFERDAQIAEFAGEADSFSVVFNFTDLQAAKARQVPCRVDVCGVVTQFGAVATVSAKDGRELVKRDITLVDDTATSMDVTLWGDKAKIPDSDFEGKPVVGIKALLLKEWNGERSGSTIESSIVTFRPDVPEAKRISLWWSQSGSSQTIMTFTDLEAVRSKPTPCRVNLCGIVTQFRPLATVMAKDGRELLKRDIVVADDTATSMDVTLWGEKGKLPDSDFENNPVIMLKGILVKEWNGGRSGGTVEPTVVTLKPDLPEAHRLQQWWSGCGSTQSFASLRGDSGSRGAALGAEDCSIAEMRRKAEYVGDQAQHYKLAARLTLVQTRKQGEQQPLHYRACAELRDGSYGKLPCNKRVDESGFCAACNLAGKTAVRLNLRCRFADFGDSAWLTTFHEPAEKVLGINADKVAEIDSGEQGRENLEAFLRQAYCSDPLELTVRAKLDMYNGEPRSNVTCVRAEPVRRRDHGRKLLAQIREMLDVAA